jgi:hypothetical protein
MTPVRAGPPGRLVPSASLVGGQQGTSAGMSVGEAGGGTHAGAGEDDGAGRARG